MSVQKLFMLFLCYEELDEQREVRPLSFYGSQEECSQYFFSLRDTHVIIGDVMYIEAEDGSESHPGNLAAAAFLAGVLVAKKLKMHDRKRLTRNPKVHVAE